MPEPLVLALDLGTTGNRAIAFTRGGLVAAKAYRELPQIYPQPGWVEHDPEEIWRSIQACLLEVLGQVDVDLIQALGITNQRETTVVWNRRTGVPVHNAIVWQCRRTTEICRAMQGSATTVRAKTGLMLDPYFSATKIRWILDSVPGAREQAAAGELLFGTVDSWVLWKLTAGGTHATEPGNASRTMLFNLHSQDWDDELLALFGVPRSMLPKVLDSDAGFGTTKKEAAGAVIPITGMMGDQQASLFAHGGWRHGLVKSTYGTGIFLMSGTGEKRPLVNGLLTTAGWRRGGRAEYALEGSIFMGGSTLQWLRDGLGILKSAAESEAMAESLGDNGGVYFVPAFQGLGAPHWDPSARGALVGLSLHATAAHVARAALESLAYQTREVVDLMAPAVGGASLLRVDGGACANNFLMQFLSDLTRLRVERPAVTETTALGAAGMAGMAAGVWTPDEFLATQTIQRVFEPRMPEAQATALHDRWLEAVQRAKGWEKG